MNNSIIKTFKVVAIIGTLLVTFTFGGTTIFQPVSGQTTSGRAAPSVYTNDSKPYGLSYGEWTAK
jgi:hypothetical protein